MTIPPPRQDPVGLPPIEPIVADYARYFVRRVIAIICFGGPLLLVRVVAGTPQGAYTKLTYVREVAIATGAIVLFAIAGGAWRATRRGARLGANDLVVAAGLIVAGLTAGLISLFEL